MGRGRGVAQWHQVSGRPRRSIVWGFGRAAGGLGGWATGATDRAGERDGRAGSLASGEESTDADAAGEAAERERGAIGRLARWSRQRRR